MKAISKILATDPNRFDELTRQQVDEVQLIILFDNLDLYDQFRAYQDAEVTLDDINYGIPSSTTVAKFGNDGTMRSPVSIVENDGHTYES